MQEVKNEKFAQCEKCGKPIVYSNLTANAAIGFDERWGVCGLDQNRGCKHRTIFVIKPRMNVNSRGLTPN